MNTSSKNTRANAPQDQPMRAMMNNRVTATGPVVAETPPSVEALLARIAELEAQLAARDAAPGADSLTGLANRATLELELERSVATARRYSRRHALLLLDIDGFSTLNQQLGRATGDQVLQHVARLLRQNIRPTDIAARLENDTFAIVLNELRADANAVMRATELAHTLARTPCIGSRGSIQLSAQLGVYAFGVDDDVPSILAAAAMNLQAGLPEANPMTSGGLRM